MTNVKRQTIMRNIVAGEEKMDVFERKYRSEKKKRGRIFFFFFLQNEKVSYKQEQQAPPNDFLFPSSSPHVLASTP